MGGADELTEYIFHHTEPTCCAEGMDEHSYPLFVLTCCLSGHPMRMNSEKHTITITKKRIKITN